MSETSSNIVAELSDTIAEGVERAGRRIVAVHARRRGPASGILWQKACRYI